MPASILGAGVWRTARKVTLPLVVPAVLGGAILTFLQAIELFGVPALISIPARYPVMATQLWEFFEYPVRIGAAAAYSLPLIVMTAVLLGLQRRLLGRRGYVTVGAKGGVRRLVRLGWWRWPLCAWALLVIAITMVLPFVVLLQAAFAKAWGEGRTLDNLTRRISAISCSSIRPRSSASPTASCMRLQPRRSPSCWRSGPPT